MEPTTHDGNMPASIALQLYTIRDSLAEDFTAAIRRVAEIGYVGVETAGFPGTTPAEARRFFDDLGLRVAAAHVSLPIGDDRQEVLDTAALLGCETIVCSYIAPEFYETADAVRQTCDRINEAAVVARENGLVLGLHNHWWEFELVDGIYPYEELWARVDPSVFFEVDTYWVKTAGLDPVAIVERMETRAPVLHIKDGPCIKGEPQVAVGSGSLDVPAVIRVSEGVAKWLIVELDECATDMFDAVQQSWSYLVTNGFAAGRSS
jgi:sugar phosphate isomerase/epimerase